MRARDDAGLDAFGDPNTIDEVTDVRGDAQQIAGLNAEFFRVTGVHPNRIAIGNFIKPLRIAGARVNERWQTKRRHERKLAFAAIQGVGMNMAFNVSGNFVVRPAPIDHRWREKFLLT